MKPLIVANWKMNPTSLKEAQQLFAAVKKGLVRHKNAEVLICPPQVYLPVLSGLNLGAQDVYPKPSGAFTGAVSPDMLKDLGVKYVIVGHSERRKYFGETDALINEKIMAIVKDGQTPILCIGETLEEQPQKREILERQLSLALEGVPAKAVSAMVVAYEPVWAIGTGKNCSPDEALSAILLIRKLIADMYRQEIGQAVRVIYGGSVKAGNASSYLKEAGAQGLLVGGASLDAKEFLAIVASVAG